MKMRFGLGVLAFGRFDSGYPHAKHPGKKYETLQALSTSEALTSELNLSREPVIQAVGGGVLVF